MRVLILVSALMLLTPAYADTVENRFAKLVTDSGITNFWNIDFGPAWPRGTRPPGLAIHWKDTATDSEKATAEVLANNFDWLDKIPNVVGFVTALRTEPTFDSTMRMNLAGLLALVQADANIPAAMHQDWIDAKNAYGGTWLTPQTQTIILNAASVNNIPLE